MLPAIIWVVLGFIGLELMGLLSYFSIKSINKRG